jgi:hypothetical protein
MFYFKEQVGKPIIALEEYGSVIDDRTSGFVSTTRTVLRPRFPTFAGWVNKGVD